MHWFDHLVLEWRIYDGVRIDLEGRNFQILDGQRLVNVDADPEVLHNLKHWNPNYKLKNLRCDPFVNLLIESSQWWHCIDLFFSLVRLLTVWSDVLIKNRPNIFKSCTKVYTAVLTKKLCFPNSPKRHKIFGELLKSNMLPRTFKNRPICSIGTWVSYFSWGMS